MKEQFHLTKGQEILYPGVRGLNFMAENQNQRETPKLPEAQKVSSPQNVRKELTPDQDWLIEHGINPQTPEKTPEEARSEAKREETLGKIRRGEAAVSGGAELLPLTDYTDPVLQNIAREINGEINRIGVGNSLSPRFVDEQLRRVRSILDANPTFADEGNRLVNMLNVLMAEAMAGGTDEKGQSLRLYLEPKDIKKLEENPIEWLNSKFTTLYLGIEEGQELSSKLFENMQGEFGAALRYVQNYQADLLVEFQRHYTVRFNLMQMRAIIGHRGIEQIQSAARQLQMHGLLYGLSMEDGRVGVMFNRLHELLEDTRLKSKRQHVTPEHAYHLQNDVIKEQILLAEKGIGLFKDIKDKEERGGTITRAVRMAYDVFVSFQRQAVIVARGKHLSKLDAYFSDPASGPLNIYNLEDLLIGKFGIYTAQEEEFVRRIKLDMADSSLKKRKSGFSEAEREDLGRRLFRDLFIMPDLLSSSWRIKGILDAIEVRFEKAFGKEDGKKRAEDLALFMRLKMAKKEEREEIWVRIAKYRPEEVVRLFRERMSDNLDLNKLFGNEVFKNAGIGNYDEFKEQFGSIIRLLREEGFSRLEQLDFSDNLDELLPSGESVREIIAKWANGDPNKNPEVFQRMFSEMKAFSSREETINTLVNNPKFEDIYTRTLVVDDALLDKLENPNFEYLDNEGNKKVVKENNEVVVFTPLSKKFGEHPGADSLVRIWNDTGNAIKAGQELIGFIKTEDPEERTKHGINFANATAEYNGQGARATCIRFTVGSFLNLSKKDYVWDVIGLDKLPLRLPMSEIEKIYGPQAKPISRGELRQQLDKIRLYLTKNIEEETDEETAEYNMMSPKERAKERKKWREKAEKTYTDLEKLIEVAVKDRVKLTALQILFYLILAAAGEGYHMGRSLTSTKAA